MSQYPTPMPAPQPAALRLPIHRVRATYVMMGILIVVFVIESLAGPGGSESSQVLVNLGANYAPLVTAGDYWRLFTANFLHIGLLHIAFNLYALYIVGTEMETFYGLWRFLVIYLLTGLSGAIASYAFTYGLSAGASTAIFGLVGTLFAFFIRNRSVFGRLSNARISNLVMVIAINLFLGLSSPGIDNWGHIGGFIGGLMLGWLLCPFYQIETRPDGMRHVVDRNSLQVEWIGVVLVSVLLVVAFWAALQQHLLNP